MKKAAITFVLCMALLHPASSLHASDIDIVRGFVLAWSQAWQSRNIDRYMSFYSPSFKSKGLDYRGWKAKKARAFKYAKSIRVEISDLWVFIERQYATASFVQHYYDKNVSDFGEKTLFLVSENGFWKIIAEEWKPLNLPGQTVQQNTSSQSTAKLDTGKQKVPQSSAGSKIQTKQTPVTMLPTKEKTDDRKIAEPDTGAQKTPQSSAESKIQTKQAPVAVLPTKEKTESPKLAELDTGAQKNPQSSVESKIETKQAPVAVLPTKEKTNDRKIAELDTSSLKTPQSSAESKIKTKQAPVAMLPTKEKTNDRKIAELDTGAATTSQSAQTPEDENLSEEENIVKSIKFQIEEKTEKVLLELNRFLIPRILTLEGDKPRIVIDIMNVSSWNGQRKIPVNGRLIRQIRTYLHHDIGKLRIVLDLNPANDYMIDQTYFKAENIYCISVR